MNFRIANEHDRWALMDYLNRLSEGKVYDVTVSLHREKRSIPQNKLYRMWLTFISKETGNDIDDLHRFFGGKFLGFQEHEVFGRLVHRPISTAALSKEQFSDFLMQVQSFMAEQGVILPDPADRYFNSFIEQYGNDKSY